MPEEVQRIIGALEARVDVLLKRVGRLEAAFIFIGTAAVGLIVAALLKDAGIL
ncbi:MAG: hypothetical protein AAGK79_13325 [Pseudomonadota bacterium]